MTRCPVDVLISAWSKKTGMASRRCLHPCFTLCCCRLRRASCLPLHNLRISKSSAPSSDWELSVWTCKRRDLAEVSSCSVASEQEADTIISPLRQSIVASTCRKTWKTSSWARPLAHRLRASWKSIGSETGAGHTNSEFEPPSPFLKFERLRVLSMQLPST